MTRAKPSFFVFDLEAQLPFQQIEELVFRVMDMERRLIDIRGAMLDQRDVVISILIGGVDCYKGVKEPQVVTRYGVGCHRISSFRYYCKYTTFHDDYNF